MANDHRDRSDANAAARVSAGLFLIATLLAVGVTIAAAIATTTHHMGPAVAIGMVVTLAVAGALIGAAFTRQRQTQ